jgi:hypothetical protein
VEDRSAVKKRRAPAGSRIRTLAAVGVALGLLALLLALWPRHEPAVAPLGASTPSGASAPPADAAAPLPAAPRPDPRGAADAAEVDPYGMPPPSPDQIKPRPEQRASTPQEQRETRQAAIRLVETSITRLLDEGRRAEQAGDGETARRNQIRVERLRKRLEQLQREAASPAPPPEAPAQAPAPASP